MARLSSTIRSTINGAGTTVKQISICVDQVRANIAHTGAVADGISNGVSGTIYNVITCCVEEKK